MAISADFFVAMDRPHVSRSEGQGTSVLKLSGNPWDAPEPNCWDGVGTAIAPGQSFGGDPAKAGRPDTEPPGIS